ncbi:MAG: hypothetical protein MUE70_01125 [Desulfobacterales bacterium]|jgi:hypothetical protein|nr:hypothetical protein [Desulfobacterales bacterium]
MSLQPQGDDLRKAVKWIADMLQDKVDMPVMKLIEKASLKFDLKPNDQEFLIRTYIKK